jgi:probable phosphoglycerate mutase
LTRFGLNEVYVSSSNRAQLTAVPTCKELGISPTILEWCHEDIAYRELAVMGDDGHRHWLFQDPEACRLLVSPEIKNLGHEWYRHKAFANGTFQQGMERIQRETDAFIESLGYRHCIEEGYYKAIRPSERRVALFAHKGIGLAFLSCLLDIPYPIVCTRLDFGHTGVTAIEFREHNGIAIPKILQLSNDSHLYHAGLSTDYQNRIFI